MSEARLDFKDFAWVDVAGPQPDDLADLAARYRLHPTSVADCLEPAHLPKAEEIDGSTFVVVRAFDPQCGDECDTVRELTRKVALFLAPGALITIHRAESPFVRQVWDRYAARTDLKTSAIPAERVMLEVISELVASYQPPLSLCLDQLDHLEEEIFGHHTRRKFRLARGYYLKRRANVLKNVLHMTLEPVAKLQAGLPTGPSSNELNPMFQNLREQIGGLLYSATDVVESTTSLISLHISLQGQRSNEASRRTNEVMRVLTIFSCFFLPVNFIAGIYGMNFQHMPEIAAVWGYPFALSAMAVTSLAVYRWFAKRGWLKGTRTNYDP